MHEAADASIIVGVLALLLTFIVSYLISPLLYLARMIFLIGLTAKIALIFASV